MTNEWMQDESLQNIDPYKLEFLQAPPIFNGSSQTGTGKEGHVLR